MLYMADVGRAQRGAMEASRTVVPRKAGGGGGDGLRRIETDTGKAGRPGATVKLKIVETAFSA